MKKEKSDLLNPAEITYILVGSIVGINIFDLPNAIVEKNYEDAWISVILGAAYPLYMALLSIYFIKLYPNHNILFLSKRYLGKIVGGTANFIFFIQFIIINAVYIIPGFNNVYGVYATAFLKPFSMSSIILFAAGLLAYSGLKSIARVNKVTFFVLIILMLLSLAALRKGSYLNLMPIFKSGIFDIAKGTVEAAEAYLGIELIFLIYPSVKKGRDIKNSILSAVVITMIIYVMAVEMTIYYQGTDVLLKSNWAFITVTESINIPVVNNFRFVFASLWILVVLKKVANYFYACEFIIRDFFKSLKRENILCAIYIIILCISLNVPDIATRSTLINFVMPISMLFNVIYVSTIAFFITIKKDENK